MARKINLPSVVGLGIEGVPHGLTVLLQAMQDGLITVDSNTIYSDSIRAQVPQKTIRAKSAQGDAVSIGGVVVASGTDYATLVQDFDRLLQSHLALMDVVDALIEQLKGRL